MLNPLEQSILPDINRPGHIFYIYPEWFGNWNTNWPSISSHLSNCAATDLA